MCETCGCDHASTTMIIPGQKEECHLPPHNHNDHHDHYDHDLHDHEDHQHNHGTKTVAIDLEKNILHKNNLIAERNRGYFEAKHILALNLVSSPGSGKTSLLEKTLIDLKKEIDFFVIEGDQQTTNDARRIQATGAPVIQINTGQGCHLDAHMVNDAAKKLEVADHSVLAIENVGNLVCPAMFDLGEAFRVVVISVTEGDDKPIKYPAMFAHSDICIINKIDLLPYVDFDVAKAKNYALQVNHHLTFIELSVKSGEGMHHWYDWLRSKI